MSMEVPGVEENKVSDGHLTSAAAFVEGGIQEACDDACSICLEAFSESDPSTVTGCKHEFHLQCILEWCQRSSQCPMCWQAISLKDPSSQELLEGVEQERNFRLNPSRNSTIFHHPTLGDFELQHLPVGANDAELEERIIQHLAAAAAMGRARHIARREGQRSRSSAHGRPHFLVFSNSASTPSGTTSPSPSQMGENEPPTVTVGTPITFSEEQLATLLPSTRGVNVPPTSSGTNAPVSDQSAASSINWSSPGQASPSNQERGGPSEFQSFSESLKSRFNSVSMRYKESISKSTRGWKERFFSRSTSVADLGSEVRREVNAGIATVTRMMERLETSDNNGSNGGSASNSSEGTSVQDLTNQPTAESSGGNHSNNANLQASCAPPQV